MSAYVPVTLADLAAEGRRFWAYCNDCQHNRFIEPLSIGLPPEHPVPTLGKRMKCSRCGSRNIHTKPDYFADNAHVGGGGSGAYLHEV